MTVFRGKKSKLLFSSVVMSNFSYCPTICYCVAEEQIIKVIGLINGHQEPYMETMNLRLKNF